MFQIDINQLIPQFILNDKNGYALAKAMEAGLQMMNDCIKQSVKLITDYDTMPEWRLDELAWETNCIYDKKADVETKRRWIKSAVPWYRIYGTPLAVEEMTKALFRQGYIEEWFEYNGEPYHFRIVTEGGLTEYAYQYSVEMIDKVKNIRSILDAVEVKKKIQSTIYVGGKLYVGNRLIAPAGPLFEKEDGWENGRVKKYDCNE